MLAISGTSLSVDKLHEVSLAKSLPQPWPTALIAMVPSTIRMEPGYLNDMSICAIDTMLVI